MKGGRRDTVYLNPKIRAHLARLPRRSDLGAAVPRQRLEGDHGAPRPAAARGLAPARKITTPASPHWFRHAAAMRIYRDNGRSVLVQAALCHRSIMSTLVYARVDAGRVRAALA